MEESNEYRAQQRKEYMAKLMPLFSYIPYLKNKEGAKTRTLYEGDELSKVSIPIPVFDGTVISFVKEAQKTGLVTKNYVYAYNKINADGPKEERLFISGATIRDLDAVIAIMSKYVLGGLTKSKMWSEAVEEGVWLHCLIKLKELLEIYDHPLA